MKDQTLHDLKVKAFYNGVMAWMEECNMSVEDAISTVRGLCDGQLESAQIAEGENLVRHPATVASSLSRLPDEG